MALIERERDPQPWGVMNGSAPRRPVDRDPRTGLRRRWCALHEEYDCTATHDRKGPA